jgi:hypothetical protein
MESAPQAFFTAPGSDARGGSGSGLARQAPSAPAPQEMREREVGLSDLTWKLEESKSAGGVQAAGESAVRSAGGKSFQLKDGVWTDGAVPDPLPKKIERVKVKSYGGAYFRLAGGSERLREMLGLGERVTIYLDGILLIVEPGGSDTLPEAAIERIVRIAEE